MTAPLVDVLARVLAEHQASIRVNSVSGVSYCECGDALPCADPLDEEVRGATHRAHVAAEQAEAVGEWLTSDGTRREVSGMATVMDLDVFTALRDYGLGDTE